MTMKIGNILIGVVSMIILTLIQDRICSKKEDRAKLFMLIPVVAIYSGIVIFIIKILIIPKKP